MKSPRYAQIAARVLADAPEESVPVTEAARAAAVERIAGTLNAKTQRRSRRSKFLGVAGAIAAAALGYLGLHAESHGDSAGSPKVVSAVVLAHGSGAMVSSHGNTQPLTNASALNEGSHLIASAGGGATVRLSTGTELSVDHDSNMEFENAGPVERFFLAQGVLRATVAKLKPNERFIVRTPDAEVEVRGTVFRVEVVDPDPNCSAGARTRVTVTEGLVEVRGAGASTYVHPGETWPAGCQASVPVPAEPTLAASESRPKARRTSVGHHSLSASTSPLEASEADGPTLEPQLAKEGSSIAQQNELFADAAAARRQGDSALAISTFELLLRRYPTSPLAEGAAVQRMSLLAASNPTAAKNAARQYLTRYPRGYARSDAEKLLAGP
ncbi:MAG: FecR domain-containing protein [Polyangiaceae bacterium]